MPRSAATPTPGERIACRRHAIGWGDDEIRLELFAADTEDRGHVEISRAGATVTIPWAWLKIVATDLLDLDDELQSSTEQARKAGGAK